MNNIKVIAFDADDTLWANESFFQEAEAKYCGLFANYFSKEKVSKELLDTEIQNLSIYGYGVKSFTLSMIETALRLSDDQILPGTLKNIIQLGQGLLNMPIDILPGINDLLNELYGKYKLIIATKGDLLDQERKLIKSGLQQYFTHVEIMSNKKVTDYQKLIKYLNCSPDEFLMIGNSMKSDILPALETGAYAAYVPFHLTWEHEKCNENIQHSRFIKLNKITDIISYLGH